MKKSTLFIVLFLMASIICFSQQVIFSDDFESATLRSNWAITAGIPNGVIDITNAIGNAGTRGVRLGKTSSAGGFVSNALDLKLNLSGQTQVEMTFKIQDRDDETQAQDGLYFSDNGGANFKKVFSFQPTDWCNSYGEFPPFDVDSLAKTNGLSLTNQFIIRFQQYGDNTLPSNDGFYLDDVKVYVPVLTYASLLFSDDFEVATLGSAWTFSFSNQTNTLAAIPNRPSNIVNIASGIGINSSRAVQMGKDCNDGFATNALDLHLNLSRRTQVAMTFKIQDRNDQTQADDGLYFSDNGGATFKKVFSFQPTDWCNSYGEFPPFDIDSLAKTNGLSLTSQFIIRFQQHGDNTLPSNDGFYLDDVKVYVPVLTYASLPFNDDFEVATLGSSWTVSFSNKTNTLAAIPNRPSNIVNIASGIGINSSRAVQMGKDCNDGFATNALDLHLNLSGKTQVAMTFKIQDRNDQTQADDGLYFSDNGGGTFKKVFSFQPTDWCNSYGEFPPFDIDSLAKTNGLSLTSQFVIRFQQHGDNTLPSNDGFYLDDVNVYVPVLTYASLPFSDDFEVATLGSAWTVSFSNQTNTLAAIPNRPSNIVNITNGIGINSSRAVQMGKDCSDGFATNALDLHLNLSGKTQQTLTFKIQDRNDQTQADDALFFSDNGGTTFKKVFSFDFSNTANVFTNYNINIDNLAAANNLKLTSLFVIRFQQHGESTLPSNDGFYLDDVNISGTVSTKDNQLAGGLRLQPNPTTAHLTINTEESIQTAAITNLIGQIILKKTINDKQYDIDVSSLSKGLYLLSIETTDGRRGVQKFVKN
jgi:Secretion system C-terminal sorting domain